MDAYAGMSGRNYDTAIFGHPDWLTSELNAHSVLYPAHLPVMMSYGQPKLPRQLPLF